jgi:hypothetical protein
MHGEVSGLAAAILFGIYFVVLFIVYISVAVANGYLATRLGKSAAAWITLSLIPIVNVFFFVYLGYTVLFFIIDRLKEIPTRTA